MSFQNRSMRIFLFILTISIASITTLDVKAQAYGDFPYFQPFTSGAQPVEVTKPTGAGANDAAFTADGLRLTRAMNSLFGAIFINNKRFTTSLGIKIAFEYSIYGGDGADGLSMFLFDAAVTNPEVGALGRGLGYTYNRTNNNYSSARKAGLTGGYLSVALDAYGNHKGQVFQENERVNGVAAPAGGWLQGGSQVTIRGARGAYIDANGRGLGFTGYPVLKTQSTFAAAGRASAELNVTTGVYSYGPGNSANFDLKNNGIPTGTNDPNYRKAFIDLIPNGNNGFYITVKIQHQNTITTVIENYNYVTSIVYRENVNTTTDFNTENTQISTTTPTLNATPPAFLRLGFGASTGGLNNIHLIKNLTVTLPYAAEAANDEVATCRNVPVIIDPYANDVAYAGLILLTPTPVASRNSIDPSQFRFINRDGTTTADPFTISNEQGTFRYDQGTRRITFTPAPGFVGETSVGYTIKGFTVPIVGGPYGDEAYRSAPGKITVRVSKCQVITNPNLPIKSNEQ
jgi:hypothetical protein